MTLAPASIAEVGRDCRRMFSANPHDPDLHLRLGDIDGAAGAPDGAVKRCKRALAASGGRGTAGAAALFAISRHADAASAATLGERALATAGGDPVMIHTVATLSAMAGNFRRTTALVRRLLALVPCDADAFNTLANAAIRLDRASMGRLAYRRSLAIDSTAADVHGNLGLAELEHERPEAARVHLRAAAALEPDKAARWDALVRTAWQAGNWSEAEIAMQRDDAIARPPAPLERSVVIPVLDYSPGAPYNIRTLLADLADFPGEVVCVFNDRGVADELASHSRIGKYAVNSHNVGVGRAWNMGLNLAEGGIVFVLNADLKIEIETLRGLEGFLRAREDAVIAGPTGEFYDRRTLASTRYLGPGDFDAPTEVDRVGGFLFALHAERFHAAGLCFDPRLGPFFYEETDIAEKARERGLKVYAVPLRGFDHRMGISQHPRPIDYFGREVKRNHVLARNAHIVSRRHENS